MRTRVYVDGLGLFYGLLSKSPYKWLDLSALFSDLLAPDAHLEHVNYYTARIKSSASDDPRAANRQQLYLRALQHHCSAQVTIREGYMQRGWRWLRLRHPRYGVDDSTAEVLFNCEKQTDVNLACDLLSDAWHDRYEQAVVCSNESDLAGDIQAVKRDRPHLVVGLVLPARSRAGMSHRLAQAADWYKFLSPVHLADAQLPRRIPRSEIARPAEW